MPGRTSSRCRATSAIVTWPTAGHQPNRYRTGMTLRSIPPDSTGMSRHRVQRISAAMAASLICGVVLTTPGAGQAPPPPSQPGPAVCAFDTTDATMTIPIVVSLATPLRVDTIPRARQQATDYLQALLAHYQPPSEFDVQVRPVVTIDQLGNSPDSIGLGLSGTFYPPIDAGRRPAVNLAFPALSEALVVAAHRLASQQPMPIDAWVAHSMPNPITLSIIVTAGTPSRGIPIARSSIRIYKADSLVQPSRMHRPRYPRAMQRRGEHARMEVQYIVREDGWADSLSLRIVHVSVGTRRAADPVATEFAKSAAEAILKSEFRPARVRGCPVPMLVMQRVSFTIGN